MTLSIKDPLKIVKCFNEYLSLILLVGWWPIQPQLEVKGAAGPVHGLVEQGQAVMLLMMLMGTVVVQNFLGTEVNVCIRLILSFQSYLFQHLAIKKNL